MRGCRSALSFFTKLLAAYQLVKADKFSEYSSNGTQRRQISFQNCIIMIAIEVGFKTVTLSYTILSKDETSEMVTECIIRTFKEGCSMLTAWREITKRGILVDKT